MLGRAFTTAKVWLCLLAGLTLFAAAGAAEACCTPPPPACCQPPPPPPPPPSNCGCGGGHTVVVPGVNVSVQSTAIAISGASANAGGAAGASVVVGGGGGGNWSMEQGYPSVVPLLVETETERSAMRRVAYEARRKVTRRVVIQAFCIDDRSVPHPASQVSADRDVDESYEGEVYRCIAGTRLQMVYAEYKGEIRFEHGQTLDCHKGDALWHQHGELSCRPQKPARDCNERSLLRRFGAGVKVLTMVREETYTAYREERVTSASETRTSSAIVLDGGVGGIVR